MEHVEVSKPPGHRLWLSRLIRPIVSIGLLAFLFQAIGFDKFVGIMAGASIPWLICGLLLVVVALVISSYKWQWLLVRLEVRVPLLKLFISYLIAQFFNNFMPTNIGGDVVRIADIGRHTGKLQEVTASVVGERLLAGFALGLTAVFGLMATYDVSSGFTGVVVAVVAIFGILIAVFASSKTRAAVRRYVPMPSLFPLRSKLTGIGGSMALGFSNKTVLTWVILLSFAFHFTVILLNYTIFLALGIDVPLVYCFLFIPIIMALQMLPVSLNGFGVREGSYVCFFGTVGVAAAPAIAASLLFWLLVTLISMFGGVVFALRR